MHRIRKHKPLYSLKASLVSVGLKQIEVARWLGVPLTSLNAWINGYRTMPSAMLEQIEALIEEAKREEI